MMAERSLENNQEVCICFVDYEKAFDRVEEADKYLEKDGCRL